MFSVDNNNHYVGYSSSTLHFIFHPRKRMIIRSNIRYYGLFIRPAYVYVYLFTKKTRQYYYVYKKLYYNNYIDLSPSHLQHLAAWEFPIHYWPHRKLCLGCRYWYSSRVTENLVDRADESGLAH